MAGLLLRIVFHRQCSQFSGASKEKLLQEVCLRVAPALEIPAKQKCATLQDYTDLALFLSQKQWSIFMDEARPPADCLLRICEHVMR